MNRMPYSENVNLIIYLFRSPGHRATFACAFRVLEAKCVVCRFRVEAGKRLLM